MSYGDTPELQRLVHHLKVLWTKHEESVLAPRILDNESALEIRYDIDEYDTHVAGLAVSVIDNEVDHIEPEWLHFSTDDLEARVLGLIASLSDNKELKAVAENYRIFKRETDEIFDIVKVVLKGKYNIY